MIAPHRIKFRGKSNYDFDLICGAAFESTDTGEIESFLTKEAVSSNVYDGSRKNIHGYHYTEVVNVQITLIKQNYGDITEQENRKILSWLTGSNKTEELVVYKDDSDVISYRLIGNVISVEQYKLSTNRVVGYILTFEHIAPYAYSPVKTLTKTITTPQTFVINCHTDAYEKNLYPKMTINMGDFLYIPIEEDPTADAYEMIENVIYEYDNSRYIKISGQKHLIRTTSSISTVKADASTYNNYYFATSDSCIYKGTLVNNIYGWEKVAKIGTGFEIKNTYYEDDKDITIRSSVIDCYKNEVITIDGDNRLISSSETPMRIIGDSFNWEWVYFVPGENHITISGNCTVAFEWVEPIKIGHI